MTALAVAIVLCCAMVCGLRVYDLRHNERLQQALAKSRDWNGLALRVDALSQRLDEWERAHDGDVSTLKREVEQLRASSALRGLS